MEKTAKTFGLVMLAFIGCNQVTPHLPQQEPLMVIEEPEFDIEAHIAQYEQLKKRIPNYRNSVNSEEAKTVMFHLLADSIWPYWYGTEWDFNGITETPRKGLIACGYFVTTTLRDAGVSLNRYKVAQQAAAEIARLLCDPGSIKTFTKLSDLENYLAERGDEGVYVLGLDNHVGFAIRDKGINYFVHSDYTRDGVAKREVISGSVPIVHSKVLVVGSVLDNTALVDKWRYNKP